MSCFYDLIKKVLNTTKTPHTCVVEVGIIKMLYSYSKDIAS